MTHRALVCRFSVVAALVGALSACAGSSGASAIPGQAPAHRDRSGSTPITHIVLMVQENRTFNDLFATFPGAVGTTTGQELVSGVEKPIPLTESKLEQKKNVTHLYKAFLTAYQNGAMDGFNLIKFVNGGQYENTLPYEYVNPSQVKPYWAIADQWGLADEMFQPQGSDSFVAHQDLIRGSACITAPSTCDTSYASSLIDSPTAPKLWGCASDPGTKTSVISGTLQESTNGPFPCTSDFPNYGSNGYATLRDLLDAKGVSWKYYTPQFNNKQADGLWNAFSVIAAVYGKSEWYPPSGGNGVTSPETTVLKDISKGTLPAMSWVIPDAFNSDHPAYTKDTGPSWVATVVNAIGQSSYWKSTAVIVVWDDWGGFYDSVAPPLPRDNQGGPGFRVPMLLISPYVKVGTGSKGGYISNTVYSFGSILRFAEDTFNLGRLGTTDSTDTSIGDMFDFAQSPRAFTKITAPYGRSYFLHQKPSGLPVDSD